MEVDKDNAKTENEDENNNNASDEKKQEKTNAEQESSQNDGVNSPAAAEELLSEADEAHESEIKGGDGGGGGGGGGEDASESKLEEAPPPLLDLEKISEEIDEYIPTLAKSKGQDSSPPDVPISVEQYAVLLEAKIGEYDSGESPVRFSSLTKDDSTLFMQAITRLASLTKVLSDFSSDFKYAFSINRIGGVLQRAMAYVEEEFNILLEDYEIHDSVEGTEQISKQESEQNPRPLASESESESESAPPPEQNSFPGYPDETLSNLVRLSHAMMIGGFETECCQAYFLARRNALEESLRKLGFEKYSMDDVQKMQWDSLEREIAAWIRTFKEVCSVHFSMEKKLSESLFSDHHPSTSQRLFCSLSNALMIQLLNFAEAVAMTKRAAEKLFKFLDIYEALRDVLPTTETLFPEDWRNEMRTEASIIKGRLGEAMILIFMELENSIKSDSGKTPVPGGAIHPLTRYTMNYLKYVCEYKETLNQVFKEHRKIESSDSDTADESSPFHDQMVKAMDLLDANLETKSKLYRDPSLSSIFMMNNGRYILQKVRGSSEINSLMGDSWCRKRSSDLRQYHKGYQRETWGKLLHCLHPEGLMSNGKVVKTVLKERFKSFNAMFDEIHKTQNSWVVNDEQLQSELRVSISNMVIPAYRSYLGRYSQVFTPGRQSEKYVKYQAEDIETCIDELFDGAAAAAQGKRKP